MTLAGLRAANKDDGYMRGSSEWRTTAADGADRAAMSSLLGQEAPQQPGLLGPAAEAAEEAAALLVEARGMMRGQAERRRG